MSRRSMLGLLAAVTLHGCGSGGTETAGSGDPAGGSTGGGGGGTGTPEADTTEALFTGSSFRHPGLLHSEDDFARMRSNIGVAPWSTAFALLQAELATWKNMGSHADTTLRRYSTLPSGVTNNFASFQQDIRVAHECALYWKVTGDTWFADRAVFHLDSWAARLTTLQGDNDIALLALNAYQIANVAEVMGTYPGWAADQFDAFKAMMKLFSDGAQSWAYTSLTGLTVYSNWQLASLAALMAIGVLTDDVVMFNTAVDYFRNGTGNGGIKQGVYVLHPGHMGQTQESGRDQGHNTLSVGLMGVICEMAWKHGIDLYGFDNNRVLAGCEYTARGNLQVNGAYPAMPFAAYANGNAGQYATVFATNAQGSVRTVWALIYHHYANRRGIAAPNTKAFLDAHIEGVDGEFPGFGSLTYTRPEFARTSTPAGLRHHVSNGVVTLSWWGVPGAVSYTVMRSTSAASGFVAIASVAADVPLTCTDTPPAGGTYFYRVQGETPQGATGSSNTVKAVTAQDLLMHLACDDGSGTVLNDRSGNGWHATLQGGAWAEGRNGGRAVALDGVGSQITLADDFNVELGDCTVALWTVWRGAANAREHLFGLGNGANQMLVLCPKWSDGKARVMLAMAGRAASDQVVLGSALASNTWVHVAITLSADTLAVYLNGALQGQVGTRWQPRHFGRTRKNWLGRWGGEDSFRYTGLIDDFRIHHGAMTAPQVQALYADT